MQLDKSSLVFFYPVQHDLVVGMVCRISGAQIVAQLSILDPDSHIARQPYAFTVKSFWFNLRIDSNGSHP
jgi:hypothetical protein